MLYEMGEKIKEAREAKGYSQKYVSILLGKSASMISDYESGAKTPSTKTLIQLAGVLNVSLNYLAGLSNERTIVLDGLTNGQIESMIQLATEYREGKRFPGFTPHQQRILNRIMDEFGKLPKGKE